MFDSFIHVSPISRDTYRVSLDLPVVSLRGREITGGDGRRGVLLCYFGVKLPSVRMRCPGFGKKEGFPQGLVGLKDLRFVRETGRPVTILGPRSTEVGLRLCDT